MQTEESLAYFKLKNKRYDALTQYPERLIRLLFEDSVPDRYVDINKAAENIAQIYDINLKVLKHALIQEWLPPIEQFQHEDYYSDHNPDVNGSSL